MEKFKEFAEMGKVIAKEDSGIQIEMITQEGCRACAMSRVCSKGKKRFFIPTTEDFAIGDIVEVEVSANSRIFSSFVVFIIPVIFMIAFYFISKLFFSEDISVGFAILGILVSFFFIKFLDKKVEDRLDVKILRKKN